MPLRSVIGLLPLIEVLCFMACNPAVGLTIEDLISFADGNELYCENKKNLSQEVENCKTFGEALAVSIA